MSIIFFDIIFLLDCFSAKGEVTEDAPGQEGAKKKRNRKRNKAKGLYITCTNDVKFS